MNAMYPSASTKRPTMASSPSSRAIAVPSASFAWVVAMSPLRAAVVPDVVDARRSATADRRAHGRSPRPPGTTPRLPSSRSASRRSRPRPVSPFARAAVRAFAVGSARSRSNHSRPSRRCPRCCQKRHSAKPSRRPTSAFPVSIAHDSAARKLSWSCAMRSIASGDFVSSGSVASATAVKCIGVASPECVVLHRSQPVARRRTRGSSPASRSAARRGRPLGAHQALVDEGGDALERVEAERRPGAQPPPRSQASSRRRTRQTPSKQRLLVIREQAVAPVDRLAQRLLAGRAGRERRRRGKRRRLPRRPRIASAPSSLALAAASSMASGRPSSRATISAMAGAVCGVMAKSGRDRHRALDEERHALVLR